MLMFLQNIIPCSCLVLNKYKSPIIRPVQSRSFSLLFLLCTLCTHTNTYNVILPLNSLQCHWIRCLKCTVTIRVQVSATGCTAMKTLSLIQTTHSNVAGAALCCESTCQACDDRKLDLLTIIQGVGHASLAHSLFVNRLLPVHFRIIVLTGWRAG